MSILHRRKKVFERQAATGPHVTVPPWPELARMKAAQVRELAARLGIEYTNRTATAAAIHKAR